MRLIQAPRGVTFHVQACTGVGTSAGASSKDCVVHELEPGQSIPLTAYQSLEIKLTDGGSVPCSQSEEDLAYALVVGAPVRSSGLKPIKITGGAFGGGKGKAPKGGGLKPLAIPPASDVDDAMRTFTDAFRDAADADTDGADDDDEQYDDDEEEYESGGEHLEL